MKYLEMDQHELIAFLDNSTELNAMIFDMDKKINVIVNKIKTVYIPEVKKFAAKTSSSEAATLLVDLTALTISLSTVTASPIVSIPIAMVSWDNIKRNPIIKKNFPHLTIKSLLKEISLFIPSLILYQRFSKQKASSEELNAMIFDLDKKLEAFSISRIKPFVKKLNEVYIPKAKELAQELGTEEGFELIVELTTLSVSLVTIIHTPPPANIPLIIAVFPILQSIVNNQVFNKYFSKVSEFIKTLLKSEHVIKEVIKQKEQEKKRILYEDQEKQEMNEAVRQEIRKRSRKKTQEEIEDIELYKKYLAAKKGEISKPVDSNGETKAEKKLKEKKELEEMRDMYSGNDIIYGSKEWKFSIA